MKLRTIILLAVIGTSSCAKLDRAYLPPQHAPTSGGSGSFLQTPNFDGISQEPNQHSIDSFPPNGNEFSPNGGLKSFNHDVPKNITDEGFSARTPNGFVNPQGTDNADGQNVIGFGNNNFNNYENNVQNPERPQAGFERNAAILRQENQNDGETYSYGYETENGIVAEESGVATNGVEAQGGFSYTGDDGKVYSIRYTADQNGFVPEGEHLPTPPPVPLEIQRALEQNARDEAAGIFDDGSYDSSKYQNHADNNVQQPQNGNFASNADNFGAIQPDHHDTPFSSGVHDNNQKNNNDDNGFNVNDFNDQFHNGVSSSDQSPTVPSHFGTTEAHFGRKPFTVDDNVQDSDDTVVTNSAESRGFNGSGAQRKAAPPSGFGGPAYLPPDHSNSFEGRRLRRRS